MKPINAAIIKFIQATLNDDHGISEEAYNALVELHEEAYKDERELSTAMTDVKTRIDATEGRFYLPS